MKLIGKVNRDDIMNKAERLQTKQQKLIEQLFHGSTSKELKKLNEILDIERELTLMETG